MTKTSRHNNILILLLTIGVFSIINTEMGVIGLLPLIAAQYGVSIARAGWLVSVFALAVAIAGPTLPLLCSGVNRKHAMLVVLGVFLVGNLVSAFTPHFSVLLAARMIPGLLHPVYCSLAFTVAATSVGEADAPRSVAKVLMGVSAGMVLGVPLVSFLANATSLRIGMLSFAAVSAAVLLATALLAPSLPVRDKLSYGTQLRTLRKGSVWLAIFAVVCLNGAVFGVYSYYAAFLEDVTGLPGKSVSGFLLVFGLANIVGNLLGGRELSRRPSRFVLMLPCLLGAIYLMLLTTGYFPLWTAVLTLVWGILAGAAANVNQYLLMRVMPEAPDFANGLFLTSTNLGTMLGAMVCGGIIARAGIRFSLMQGVAFLLPALLFIALSLSVRRRYPAVLPETGPV